MPEEKIRYCSFCGKSEYIGDKIVAGRAALICGECVIRCIESIWPDNLVGLLQEWNHLYPKPSLHGAWKRSAPEERVAFSHWAIDDLLKTPLDPLRATVDRVGEILTERGILGETEAPKPAKRELPKCISNDGQEFPSPRAAAYFIRQQKLGCGYSLRDIQTVLADHNCDMDASIKYLIDNPHITPSPNGVRLSYNNFNFISRTSLARYLLSYKIIKRQTVSAIASRLRSCKDDVPATIASFAKSADHLQRATNGLDKETRAIAAAATELGLITPEELTNE